MNPIQFTLSNPVKYSLDGVDTDGTFITLNEPSIKNLNHVSALKAIFYDAARKNAETNTPDLSVTVEPAIVDPTLKKDVDKVDGEAMMVMLYSQRADMAQVFNVAKKLFFSVGVASVEGVADFTPAIFDTMSIPDFEKMVGEYLINFILQSVLN